MTDLTVIEFPKSFPRDLREQGQRAGFDIEERRLFAGMLRGYRATLAVELGALRARGRYVESAIAGADAFIKPLEASLGKAHAPAGFILTFH